MVYARPRSGILAHLGQARVQYNKTQNKEPGMLRTSPHAVHRGTSAHKHHPNAKTNARQHPARALGRKHYAEHIRPSASVPEIQRKVQREAAHLGL